MRIIVSSPAYTHAGQNNENFPTMQRCYDATKKHAARFWKRTKNLLFPVIKGNPMKALRVFRCTRSHVNNATAFDIKIDSFSLSPPTIKQSPHKLFLIRRSCLINKNKDYNHRYLRALVSLISWRVRNVAPADRSFLNKFHPTFLPPAPSTHRRAFTRKISFKSSSRCDVWHA